MGLRLKTNVTFNEAALRKILGTSKILAEDVLPEALKSLERPIAASFKKYLPDSRVTHSRLKQSKKSRERWPYKLNRQVSRRLKVDDRGALLISGVRIPQGQYVYIDMHHKAQTVGRRHILWGKKFHQMRKMPRDVPKLVRFENAKLIYQTIFNAIRNAAAMGRFQ